MKQTTLASFFKKPSTPKAPEEPQVVKGPGAEVVGRRLKVWWPKDSAWYAGTITAFNGRTKHTITYDDGETEVLNLSKETTRFLPSKRKVEESDDDGEEVVTSKPRTARQVALATK